MKISLGSCVLIVVSKNKPMKLIYTISALLLSSLMFAQTFSFYPEQTEGCNSLTTRLVNTSTDVTNYTFEWTWGSGQASNMVTNVFADFDPGIHEIVLTVSDLGGTVVSTVRDTVVVYADPFVRIEADRLTTCFQEAITLSIDSIWSETPIVDYLWIFGDGTVDTVIDPAPHLFTTAGAYYASLRVEDENGCSSGESEVLRLQITTDKPNASFQVSEDLSCSENLTVDFTNTTTASSGRTITSYRWQLGDGTTTSAIDTSYDYTAFGTYPVRLTVTQDNGCTDVTTHDIILDDFTVSFMAWDSMKPGIDVTDSALFKSCIGNVQLQSNGSRANIFAWDIGNDGIVDYEGIGEQMGTISHRFESAGMYPIKLIASNAIGCESFVIDTIEVEDSILITKLPHDIFTCDTSEILELSFNSSRTADSIVWYLNSETPIGFDATEIITTLPEGQHELTITVFSENYCAYSATSSNFAEVLQPEVRIVRVSQMSGCIPLNVDFIGEYNYAPVTGTDSIVSVEWDFDGNGINDIANELSPSYIYFNRGTFLPTLRIETQRGCQASATSVVNTGDQSPVDYSLIPEMCTWESAEFRLYAEIDELSAIDTIWYTIRSIADTSIEEEVNMISPPGSVQYVHFDDTVGYYNINMRVSDHGCRTDWLQRDSVIFLKGPLVSVDKSFDCSSPLEYTFFADKLIDADSLYWSVYKYNAPYDYQDTLAELPAEEELYSAITVADSLLYNFSSRGDYKIQLVAKNNQYPKCTDTAVIDWIPVRELIVDFELDDYTVCQGGLLDFNNDTLTTAQDMFATGVALYNNNDSLYGSLSSTENNFDIAYTAINERLYYPERGTSEIRFYGKDINNCIDSVSKSVEVFKPIAGFYILNSSNCLPFTAEFNDTSSSEAAIVERIWDTNGETDIFDTGNLTYIQDEYTQIGTRTPQLTVIDEHSCVDVFSIPDGIAPIVPDVRFSIFQDKICIGGDISISLPADTVDVYTKPVDSIQWFIDDEYVQTTLNAAYPDAATINTPGVKQVMAIGYIESPTSEMCMNADSADFEVKDIQIKLPPNNTNVCKGRYSDAILWLADSVYTGMDDVNSITWYVDDVYTPTQGLYARNLWLPETGQHKVKMVVQTDYIGCELLQDSIDVYVHNRDVRLLTTTDTLCVGEQLGLDLSDHVFLEAVPHYWLAGNGDRIEGTFAPVSYVYESFPNIEDLRVVFKVDENAPENSESCIEVEASRSLMIYPIDADFDRGINDDIVSGCVPLTIDFINTSEGTENEYIWTIDTISSQDTNVSYMFTEPGKTYNIRLDLSSSKCTHSKTKIIETYPEAQINLSADDTVTCDYNPVQLTATGDFESVTSWEWEGGSSESTASSISQAFETTTHIILAVRSVDGCTSEDSIKIYVQNEPYYKGAPDNGLVYMFMSDSTMMLTGDKAQRLITNEVFNINNDSLPGISYRWSPVSFLNCTRCASPDIDLSCGGAGDSVSCSEIPEVLSYTVYMTDSLQCFVDIEHTIDFEVRSNTKLGMPTAFSPNGDGLNDIAYARGWALVEFTEMKIYNRWGQVVFETTDIEQGWDGTFNGKMQKADTYAYVIKGKDASNQDMIAKGFISLIK